MVDATAVVGTRDRVWDRVFGVADSVWHIIVVVVAEGEDWDRVDLAARRTWWQKLLSPAPPPPLPLAVPPPLVVL